MNQDDNPKIYVMQLKELIYTAILIILTIILIIVMVNVFASKKDTAATSANANLPPNDNTSYYSYTYNWLQNYCSTRDILTNFI